MISGTIERAVGAWAYREQMCNMVVESAAYSERQFSGIRQKWPRLYDLWRGTWSGRFHPHKNNVHIPLIFSACWADAARKAASSLSSYPPVSFMGYGPDDSAIARKQESLNAAQFKDDNAFVKQVDALLCADLYGVAVMQVGWKRIEKVRIMEQIDRMPLSGKVVRYLKKGSVVSFDGPETVLLDLLDFFPQPCVARLRDMKWVIRRYFLDLDDLRYLASIGTFDKAELNRLERDGSVGAATGDLVSSIRRFQARTGMDDETARFMNKYSRPIEILEYWGDVPSELSPDGVLQRVVTVANRRYMMRNKPNPYNHGLLPFVAFSPTPDLHYFYAPGKAEVVEKLQIVGNRYINQSLDAADLQIDPMWFYDRSSGLTTKNFYARPGRLVGVNGNPANVISQMKQDFTGINIADSKLAQIREFLQMGTGIVDDAVQGLGGDSRQTAREFVGRREAAGTRLMLESRLYEENMLEAIANQFSALSKQFLEPPVEVMILGDGAMLDQDTGLPIAASRETLSAYDLFPSYSARALGATMGLSKQMQQQNLLQLLTALGTPIGQSLMGQINAVNFFRGIFRTFEVPNINDIFVVNPVLQQFMQSPELQQMMQGRGMAGIPTSGQIAGGASVLSGMPGAAQGSAQSLMAPPDIRNQMSPIANAA
jgi:hypothetical protein